ncbi:MAG: hypothetical protein CMI27_00655 [Opitutae bacterium]|nr:hypothetical protein [Opitutae bacterium]
MNIVRTIGVIISLCLYGQTNGQKVEDFFKKYAGEIPAKVHYANAANPKNIVLRGVDPTKGIIYAKIEGLGALELELRSLSKQNISYFEFTPWRDPRYAVVNPLLSPQQLAQAKIQKKEKIYLGQVIAQLENENYQLPFVNVLRPTMYKLMLFMSISPQNFPIHGKCLTYVKSLIELEQFGEAFYLLSRLNLSQLDDFGYREFSEAALDLTGKMIRANPKSAKVSLALLRRVNIRDDSGDHEAYLRLADSLRNQGLFTEAIAEYGRLGPLVNKSTASPYKSILRVWPVYCYIKNYELYSKAAAKDKRYNQYASKYFNAALQGLKALDEDPPARQSNEFSLYKLVRALVRVQYARRTEAMGDQEKAEEYYRQSVLEVTEGIVSARVGLDWLPESLLMAGDAYEKLKQYEAAKNVYQQVTRFFPSSKWDSKCRKRLEALPSS